MGQGRIVIAATLLALATGCSQADAGKRQQVQDPVMTEAIEGQLLVDPDLSQQNMRNMAVAPGGPVDPARPLPDASEAARR